MFLFLLACTSPDSHDTAATTDPVHDPVVIHLAGTSQYYDVGGTARGDPSDELLCRTITPADASLEELVRETSGGDVSDYTVVGVIDPDAATWTFSFTTGTGSIEGEGAFDAGETWEWTAWHSTSTFVDGDYVGWTTTSEDQLDGDAFTAHKEIFDDAGDPQGSIEETMHVISQEDWENGVRE